MSDRAVSLEKKAQLTPRIGILENTSGVWIVALEETGACCCAGSRGDVALLKSYPFANQSIQVRCFEMWVTQSSDRVESLLIRDDENNVRSIVVLFFILNEHLLPAVTRAVKVFSDAPVLPS